MPRMILRSLGSAALATAMISATSTGSQRVGQAHVGHDRAAQHAQPAVHRHDHLGHGRHADHVGPDHAQETILGARLQVRSQHGHEHALVRGEVFAPGDLRAPVRSTPRSYGRDMSGKRGPRRSSLMPTSGLLPIRLMWSSMSMMSPLAYMRVHAAAGVGDDQQLGPQRLHHAHRQRDLLHAVAFVGVKAALHRHHAAPTPAVPHTSRPRWPVAVERRKCGMLS